jgi:D-xylose transport system permease protein
MVFVIISAEIDLSVGSMMGLLGGVAAIFDVWLGWPLPLTVAVTLVWVWCWAPGTAGGLPTAKSRRLLSPWRGCWPSGDLNRYYQRHYRLPHQRRHVANWSELPLDGVGFTIGVVGLLAFVAWQWRGRMRRQALGLASPASTSVVGVRR